MSNNKAKNLFESLKYAREGMLYNLKTQRNMRIHAIIAIIIAVMGSWLNITTTEWAIIVMCIMFVFFAELMNTAVELLIDAHYKDSYSELAKNAKDVAAGAVLSCAIGSMIVGILIFLPKILLLVFPNLFLG